MPRSSAGRSAAASTLTPKLQVLSCTPGRGLARTIPAEYLDAFESAAARYGLGRRGVWTLAAIARLESNFGRGMSRRQLRRSGPLGLDPAEWRHYAVDGDGDGRIRHADPADSAATLARLIWSRGSLRAGVFIHNQAAVVRAGGARRGRPDEGSLQGRATSTGAVALPNGDRRQLGQPASPANWSTDLVTGRDRPGRRLRRRPGRSSRSAKPRSRAGAPGWPERRRRPLPLLGRALEWPGRSSSTRASTPPCRSAQRSRPAQEIATFRPGGSIETGLADSRRRCRSATPATTRARSPSPASRCSRCSRRSGSTVTGSPVLA